MLAPNIDKREHREEKSAEQLLKRERLNLEQASLSDVRTGAENAWKVRQEQTEPED